MWITTHTPQPHLKLLIWRTPWQRWVRQRLFMLCLIQQKWLRCFTLFSAFTPLPHTACPPTPPVKCDTLMSLLAELLYRLLVWCLPTQIRPHSTLMCPVVAASQLEDFFFSVFCFSYIWLLACNQWVNVLEWRASKLWCGESKIFPIKFWCFSCQHIFLQLPSHLLCISRV